MDKTKEVITAILLQGDYQQQTPEEIQENFNLCNVEISLEEIKVILGIFRRFRKEQSLAMRQQHKKNQKKKAKARKF